MARAVGATNDGRLIGGRLEGVRIPSLRLIAAALATILLVLVADAFIRDRGEFDYDLIRAVRWLDFPGLEPVLRGASELTGSFWAITLWSTFVVVFIVSRRWLAALALAAFPVAGGVNWLIRLAVQRPRPEAAVAEPDLDPSEIADLTVPNDFASFPSGHVVGAVLLWGFVFFLAGSIRNTALRYTVRFGSVAVIVLSGLSRIWLTAHWAGDVVAAYALGGLVLVGAVVAYRAMAPTTTGIPLVKAAPVPHDDGLPHAHALTSTILFRDGTVAKVYNPGFVPRFLYWVSFQAPFAYAHNRTALEAAVLRRNLAGKLTEYWYGSNRVAPALGVSEVDGRLALVGHYVEGEEPRDHHAARAFLHDLADRFDQAGLPTWQIDPRQPRSLGNVLETPSGEFTIIDLESGVVSPLASPRAWARAVRRGIVPFYDDVYFDVTRAYIEREAPAMTSALGEAWLDELRSLLDEAEAAAAAWHESEPRWWSRLARSAPGWFGLRELPGWFRAKVEAGRLTADRWMETSIERWVAEGRISEADAGRLRSSLLAPGFQAVLPHFGVHLLIGVALRFPVGSIVRVSYVVGNLAAATLRLAFRRISRQQWKLALSIHSPLVMIIAGLPGIGTFSYLASKPMRSNHLVVRLALDTVGEKLPGRLYERSGLQRLIAGRAKTLDGPPTAGGHSSPAPPPSRG